MKTCDNAIAEAAEHGFSLPDGRQFRLNCRTMTWETREGRAGVKNQRQDDDDILPLPSLNFEGSPSFGKDAISRMTEEQDLIARENAIRLGLTIEQTDKLLGRDDEREDRAPYDEEAYVDEMNKQRLSTNEDRLVHPIEATLAANMAGKAVARVKQQHVKQGKLQARLR